MKKIIFFTLLFTSFAFAAEHGEAGHGLDEQTIKTIIYQAINVGIIFVALAYYLRRPLADFFRTKRDSFINESQKAEISKKSAEQEHMNLKVKLSKLESTAEESASRARAEAADMKNAMVSEAKQLSEKIKTEAALAAKLEIEKAKNQLKEQMIREAMELSRSQLTQKVSNEDHLRLQGEFLTNIQAVEK